MTHLEDAVLYNGADGARQAINTLQHLRDMLTGSAKGRFNATVKWDGAPAIFAGSHPAVADGKFFILSDDGVLTMLKANTVEYIQLDHAEVLDGQDSWGPLALAGGRMLLRDSRQMVCINVGARE